MAKPSEGVHLEISANAADAIKELTNVIKSLNSTQKAANVTSPRSSSAAASARRGTGLRRS